MMTMMMDFTSLLRPAALGRCRWIV